MHFLRVMCQEQCNHLHLRWINGLLSALAHIFVISHWDGRRMIRLSLGWGLGLFGWFYYYNRHQEHKIGVWRVRGWIVSSLLRTGVVPKTKQPCMTDGGSTDLRWPFFRKCSRSVNGLPLRRSLPSWNRLLDDGFERISVVPLAKSRFLENYYEMNSQRFIQPRRRVCNHLRVARIGVDKFVLRVIL